MDKNKNRTATKKKCDQGLPPTYYAIRIANVFGHEVVESIARAIAAITRRDVVIEKWSEPENGTKRVERIVSSYAARRPSRKPNKT